MWVVTGLLGLFSAVFLSSATLSVLARRATREDERKTLPVSLIGNALQVAALLTLYWGSLHYSVPSKATAAFAATVALGLVIGVTSFAMAKRKMDLIAKDREATDV